ncbi:hypothetical protein [Flavobacterium orientale]|uniref:Secreted protein n=1 Tax=Flavobacterium orientale TaxID=1756020 RepID=A0A916XVU1_9FLAO|nr:hypothetical protein [Flavobacterium orientale]GGD15621.1 hypothetical protein GCM10011343_03200 [Flavobacterium orientale]
MRQLLTIFIFILLSHFTYAQLDGSVRPPKFGAVDSPIAPKTNTPFDGGIKFSPKYKIGEDPTPEPLIQEKKPDMTQQDNFIKPDHSYNPKWLEKDSESSEAYKKSQYFGDYKTKHKKLRILCRDHEYVDGDRVRIYQNDNIIANDIHLVGGFKEIYVDLVPGFNKIEFMALNQGTSGPNTAEFKIIDENGNEIMGNIWNLATGVKASLIVIQE